MKPSAPPRKDPRTEEAHLVEHAFIATLGAPTNQQTLRRLESVGTFEVLHYSAPSKLSLANEAVLTTELSFKMFDSAHTCQEFMWEWREGTGLDANHMGYVLADTIDAIVRRGAIGPNQVVVNLPFFLFPGMDNCIIVDFFPYKPIWVYVSNDDYRVERIIPVTREEALWAMEHSASLLFHTMIAHNYPYWNPLRAPFLLPNLAPSNNIGAYALDCAKREGNMSNSDLYQEILFWFQRMRPEQAVTISPEMPSSWDGLQREIPLAPECFRPDVLQLKYTWMYLSHAHEMLYRGWIDFDENGIGHPKDIFKVPFDQRLYL